MALGSNGTGNSLKTGKPILARLSAERVEMSAGDGTVGSNPSKGA